MSFIQTVPPESATGSLAELYEADRVAFGRLPNLTLAFSLRPEVYAAWKQLNAAVKSDMDLRLYELATIAAARQLRSTYCMLAHGSVLLDKFMSADDLRSVTADHRGGGLTDAETATMDLAAKVAADATAITEADIDHARASGLSDKDILGVITAAAARCFFSTVLDATGTLADSAYNGLEPPELREALTVGRPIAG